MKRTNYILSIRTTRLDLLKRCHVMGVINMTPDSFSRDGCLTAGKNFTERAVRLARKMIRDGADILDLGGESSRPGAEPVSAGEEIRRVIPAIDRLVRQVRVPISVDTCKPEVVRSALDAGAGMINNIEGTSLNKELLRMIRNYDAALVLMHMRGTPRTMQKNVRYRDLIAEINESLKISIEKCLEIGIKSDKIVIDPGIGFGKTVDQNLEIINRLKEFKKLNHPVLIGTSRKSFIGKILDRDVTRRLWGTAATISVSILNGANIVRVHDVKEMRDVVKMTEALKNVNTS